MGKVGVDKTIQVEAVISHIGVVFKVSPLIFSPLQVSSNGLHSNGMTLLGLASKLRELGNSKGNIWASVDCQVLQHANSSGIIPLEIIFVRLIVGVGTKSN